MKKLFNQRGCIRFFLKLDYVVLHRLLIIHDITVFIIKAETSQKPAQEIRLYSLRSRVLFTYSVSKANKLQ